MFESSHSTHVAIYLLYGISKQYALPYSKPLFYIFILTIPSFIVININLKNIVFPALNVDTFFQCLVENVTKNGTCPYPKCDEVIDKKSKRVALFEKILSQMFTVYEATYNKIDLTASDDVEHVIVKGLTGESLRIPFYRSMTINQLKNALHKEWKHKENKMKLLYDGKDMQVNMFTMIFV